MVDYKDTVDILKWHADVASETSMSTLSYKEIDTILDLVEYQQAKLQALVEDTLCLTHTLEDNERLTKELETVRGAFLEICELKDTFARIKLDKFVTKLKEKKCHYCETEHTFEFDGVTVEDIDEVYKEMVGKSNG